MGFFHFWTSPLFFMLSWLFCFLFSFKKAVQIVEKPMVSIKYALG